MDKTRRIKQGMTLTKHTESYQLAGGIGALLLPLLGYITAFVQVRTDNDYEVCIAALPKVVKKASDGVEGTVEPA